MPNLTENYQSRNIEVREHITQDDVRSNQDNKVAVQSVSENTTTAKRLLDLNNIQTVSLQPLSPSEKETDALKTDRKSALVEYADRLRGDYIENRGDFREGLKLLSDSLDKGEQITVTCSCRNGEMCHADVVKMAIEKVNLHIKNQQLQETKRIERDEISSLIKENSQKEERLMNPRTQRAINEILAFNENDLLLEKINQTDGRNRSEQASYLGKSSQFIRDIYERGANIVGGKLILPQEKLTISEPLTITTQDYAVKRIGNILKDESKAKEIVPNVIEYANKIAGQGSDGETKLKVFNWIYDSLEGKAEFLKVSENERTAEPPTFEATLANFGFLADEMYALESPEKDALTQISAPEKDLEESQERLATIAFERIDLNRDIPTIPAHYSKAEIEHLINYILPEIDRKLENGIAINEILKPFNETIRQSSNENAFRKLEKISQGNGNPKPASESINAQLERIELHKQNIIELSNPREFIDAQGSGIKAFYRKSLQESAKVISRLDEIGELSAELKDKSEEKQLKKELNRIQESKPSFAFKMNDSREIIIGTPSAESVAERNFVASYINFQLRQPESKLRHENERYRSYALQIEEQTTKPGFAKTASEIRAENASIGLKWKNFDKVEKAKQSRPLTQKEMQFLFTESSPSHFTTEMTALKLSFSHTGLSRNSMTESLLKGEIKPSLEAAKLIESLESRLNRRDIKDSISATKHFFESIKTPNESLKYKNTFDHRDIYTFLPPFEKDFVYQKAKESLSNLETISEKPRSLGVVRQESEKERPTEIETAKAKLNPKNLSLDTPKIPTEIKYQVSSTQDNRPAINEINSQLGQQRLESYQSQKIEVLRNGIKQDLEDLMKENAWKIDSKLENKISEIVGKNMMALGLKDERTRSIAADALVLGITEKLQPLKGESLGILQGRVNGENKNNSIRNQAPALPRETDQRALSR